MPDPQTPALPRPVQLPDMICFALYSANHAMQRIYQPLLARLGLTYPQYLVLTALWAQDDRSVGDLGRALQLETNTLTPLLKRMEAQGVLTRARSTRDERQVRIRLTDKGRALQAEVPAIGDCVVSACDTEPAHLEALRDEVAELRDRLRSAE